MSDNYKKKIQAEGGDNEAEIPDFTPEQLAKYYEKHPRAGCGLCTYDASWDEPKCCFDMWSYELGLRILMCCMILELP